jgi:hypothetical protein
MVRSANRTKIASGKILSGAEMNPFMHKDGFLAGEVRSEFKGKIEMISIKDSSTLDSLKDEYFSALSAQEYAAIRASLGCDVGNQEVTCYRERGSYRPIGYKVWTVFPGMVGCSSGGLR